MSQKNEKGIAFHRRISVENWHGRGKDQRCQVNRKLDFFSSIEIEDNVKGIWGYHFLCIPVHFGKLNDILNDYYFFHGGCFISVEGFSQLLFDNPRRISFGDFEKLKCGEFHGENVGIALHKYRER